MKTSNPGPIARRLAEAVNDREAERIAKTGHTHARPRLTIETVPEYLDWLMDRAATMHQTEMKHHLTAVELIIRRQGNEAQAKATQHTLVEDGVIAPPPVAS